MDEKTVPPAASRETRDRHGWRLLLALAILAGVLIAADQVLWREANLIRYLGKGDGLIQPVDAAIASHVLPELKRAELLEKMEQAKELPAFGAAAIELHKLLGDMGHTQQQHEPLQKLLDRHGTERDKNVLEAYKLLITHALKTKNSEDAHSLLIALRPLAETPSLDVKLLDTMLGWAEKAKLEDLQLSIAEQLNALPNRTQPQRLRLARMLIKLYNQKNMTEKAQPLRDMVEQHEKAEKVQALGKKIMACFEKKDYLAAEQQCLELAKVIPDDANPWYNLACAQARQGRTQEALKHLAKSVELGFNDPAHIKEDSDLESLRGEAAFQATIATASTQLRNAPYEKAEPIEGIRTEERFPENGFRYRVRMSPEATAEKPQRLIVWIHPLRSSGIDLIEPLVPRLSVAGFALMILTEKQFRGWSAERIKRLFTGTIPDLANITGIDIEKPIIIGQGPGGQAALQAWEMFPELVGGMVLSSAYPLDPKKYAAKQIVVAKLPQSSAIRTIPVYVVQGKTDAGARFWQQRVAPIWHKGGIPLIIRAVPGKEGDWLIHDAEVEPLLSWLQKVASGELPGLKATAVKQKSEKQ